MYTQCPDCNSSFRVTAEVLKKAGGKVRCGGCHNAFNALAYLSERKPSTPVALEGQEEAVPELRPDTGQPAQTGPLPSGSSGDYEQLLADTGDEEILFQDTGIEWRLLDGSEDDLQNSSVETELFEGRPESRVDEILDDAPTPVDEFLTETPADIDAAEVFAADEVNVSLDAMEVFDPERPVQPPLSVSVPPEDELRFDDNTGLPEDFDFDAPSTQPTQQEEQPREVAPAAEPELLPADLAFGDPDEWGELLQEVATVAPSAATHADSDHDAHHALQPVTLAEELDALPDPDADDWSDAPADADTGHATRAEESEAADVPFDLDTQFSLQALSLGIELSGSNDMDETGADDSEPPTQDAEPGPAPRDAHPPSENEPTADETAISALALQTNEDQPAANEHVAAEATEEIALADESESASETEEPAGDAGPVGDDLRVPPLEALPADTGELQLEIEKARELVCEDHDASVDPEEQVVPPPTEEEQTVNMMIDQDLMRLAIPDQDGMASTIVFESKAAREEEDGGDTAGDPAEIAPGEDLAEAGFETIIMEGAFARTEAEQKRLAAEREARDRKKQEKARLAAEQAAREKAASARMRYGVLAGAVVLGVLLVGQFLHQSRADLATVPAIGGAIEPVYRAVGAPITPDWDVKGWRLEVQGDSVGRPGEPTGGEAAADVLTIYSKLANEAERALPYPLIGVSLTNRYEEVIGSRVFEPSEYLAEASGARGLVAPGEAFEPAIIIDSVSAEATGYRLNVCYRAEGDKLRCAIEDFR